MIRITSDELDIVIQNNLNRLLTAYGKDSKWLCCQLQQRCWEGSMSTVYRMQQMRGRRFTMGEVGMIASIFNCDYNTLFDAEAVKKLCASIKAGERGRLERRF